MMTLPLKFPLKRQFNTRAIATAAFGACLICSCSQNSAEKSEEALMKESALSKAMYVSSDVAPGETAFDDQFEEKDVKASTLDKDAYTNMGNLRGSTTKHALKIGQLVRVADVYMFGKEAPIIEPGKDEEHDSYRVPVLLSKSKRSALADEAKSKKKLYFELVRDWVLEKSKDAVVEKKADESADDSAK